MSQKSSIEKNSAFWLFLLCLYLIYEPVFANPYYDNNSNIRRAHQDLYALRLVSAEKLLRTEEQTNHLNGYITFYRLFSEIIALTVSNSPEQFTKGAPSLNSYLKTLRELPDNSPDYKMLLGEAYVYTGLSNIKYDNKFSGLINCIKGYNLLEDNAEKYPQFEPDDKIFGIVQIGVAFMPRALRWGAQLFNIKSNPQEGLKNIARFSEFARGKPGYEEEAFLFTMAGYRLMNQDDAAMKLIKEKMNDFKEMAVLDLIAATVCAQANDAETALILLSDIAPEKLEIAFPQLLYMQGKTKLMRLDPDTDLPLIGYLKVSPVQDYIKTILYDLACFYYVSANTTRYREYLEQVKTRGREFLSRDVEAAF